MSMKMEENSKRRAALRKQSTPAPWKAKSTPPVLIAASKRAHAAAAGTWMHGVSDYHRIRSSAAFHWRHLSGRKRPASSDHVSGQPRFFARRRLGTAKIRLSHRYLGIFRGGAVIPRAIAPASRGRIDLL
jgi:hypothetical protein